MKLRTTTTMTSLQKFAFSQVVKEQTTTVVKAQKVVKEKKPPYKLPECYNDTYEDNTNFKDNKAQLWMWNVNGLNAIMTKGLFQDFLDQVKPDILCLNEVRMTEEKLVKLNVPGYQPRFYDQYWNCSKSIKGYSGTAIFTKVKPIKVI